MIQLTMSGVLEVHDKLERVMSPEDRAWVSAAENAEVEWEREQDEAEKVFWDEGGPAGREEPLDPLDKQWRTLCGTQYSIMVRQYGNDGDPRLDMPIDELKTSAVEQAKAVAAASNLTVDQVISWTRNAADAYGRAPGSEYHPRLLRSACVGRSARRDQQRRRWRLGAVNTIHDIRHALAQGGPDVREPALDLVRDLLDSAPELKEAIWRDGYLGDDSN
jgi:hypothetical protein